MSAADGPPFALGLRSCTKQGWLCIKDLYLADSWFLCIMLIHKSHISLSLAPLVDLVFFKMQFSQEGSTLAMPIKKQCPDNKQEE